MSSTVILHWERRQGFRKASLTSLQNNCEQFPEYLIAFLCSSFFGPPRTAVAAFFFFSSSLPTFFLEHWCCQVLNYQVIFHLSLKGLETMIFHKSVPCYNLENGHSRKIFKSKIFILLESNFFFNFITNLNYLVYGCCHLYSEVQDTFALKGDRKKYLKIKIGDQKESHLEDFH